MCAVEKNGSVPVPKHKEKATTTTTTTTTEQKKRENMFLIYLRVMIMFSFTDHEFFCLILRPFTMGLSRALAEGAWGAGGAAGL